MKSVEIISDSKVNKIKFHEFHSSDNQCSTESFKTRKQAIFIEYTQSDGVHSGWEVSGSPRVFFECYRGCVLPRVRRRAVGGNFTRDSIKPVKVRVRWGISTRFLWLSNAAQRLSPRWMWIPPCSLRSLLHASRNSWRSMTNKKAAILSFWMWEEETQIKAVYVRETDEVRCIKKYIFMKKTWVVPQIDEEPKEELQIKFWKYGK